MQFTKTEGAMRSALLVALSDRNTIQRIAQHFTVFCLYVTFFRISYIFETSNPHSTPWNPEVGIAVVAGAYLGLYGIPTILLATLVCASFTQSLLPFGWEIVSAAAHAIIFTGSAYFVRGFAPSTANPTTSSIVIFLCYAVALTAISAITKLTIATFVLKLSPTFLVSYVLTLSVGNLVGVMTVVPCFFVPDFASRWRAFFARWGLEQWIYVLLILVVSYIVFGLEETDKFKFFHLVFPPVIAFAVRDGIKGAVFSVLLSEVAMIAILYLREFEPETATELQLLMISLSATALILGITVSERQNMSYKLEESHIRLRESQAALLQASRISLASAMAAALAHELNQPLSSIRSFVRSAKRKLDLAKISRSELMSDINSAVKQVDVAANLIRATRTFVERGEIVKQKIDLDNIIRTCSELTAPELRLAKISWQVVSPKQIPGFVGNPMQIQQVILNLVRNAREAIVNGKAKNREIDLTVSLHAKPGFIEVSVSDSGPGVSAAVRKMLFKPLNSSKSDGLGLGLSLCSTIVSSHGGDIWFDAGSSTRTRFAFTIPLTNSAQH